MYVTELDSFVQKFQQLWKAGVTAHLDVDCHAGKAWVGLRVQLGHVPGPVQHQVHRPSHQRPHRGPAYQRRQERRQASKAAEESSRDDNSLPADKASNKSVMEQDDLTDKSEDDHISNTAEQAEGNFACDICDFKSNWKNGLSVHISRKHAQMEQLDGGNSVSDDLDDDEDKYMKTIEYWKRGWLGTVFQTFLDAVDVIENSDLTEV
jgi:hypothetical protein